MRPDQGDLDHVAVWQANGEEARFIEQSIWITR
jgi:hypothetical protein